MPANSEVKEARTYRFSILREKYDGRGQFKRAGSARARSGKEAVATWIEEHPDAPVEDGDRFAVRCLSSTYDYSLELFTLQSPQRTFNIVSA